MRRSALVAATIVIAALIVATFVATQPDREPQDTALPPSIPSSVAFSPTPEPPRPPAAEQQRSDAHPDTGASTDGPTEEYSYGRGYVVEDPDPTDVPETFDDLTAADIARIATDNGLLLHRYEVGFLEQNQAMIRTYPVYETAGYADNNWYTWDNPTVGMTILLRDPQTGDNTVCTLTGFARNPESGDTYGITAGHCAEENHTEVYWQPAGSPQLVRLGSITVRQTAGKPTADSPFGFDTDVALFLISAEPSAAVNPLIANVYQATSVLAPEDLVPGQQVCKMGYRTEITCGSVIAANDSFVRVNLYTMPGDSGGVLYAPRDDGTVAIIGALSGSPTFTTGEAHDFLADFSLLQPVLAGMELQYVN
ncbi:trypsin [Corynebacterium glucuronolyticum]